MTAGGGPSARFTAGELLRANLDGVTTDGMFNYRTDGTIYSWRLRSAIGWPVHVSHEYGVAC